MGVCRVFWVFHFEGETDCQNDFESGAFNHSATLPAGSGLIKTPKPGVVNLNPVNIPRLTIPG
jgi:hypothetical protein